MVVALERLLLSSWGQPQYHEGDRKDRGKPENTIKKHEYYVP